jgi:hypothetical protein
MNTQIVILSVLEQRKLKAGEKHIARALNYFAQLNKSSWLDNEINKLNECLNKTSTLPHKGF